MGARTEVNVVGLQDRASKLRVAVGVLNRQTTARQNPDSTVFFCLGQAIGSYVERFLPCGCFEFTSFCIANQGPRDAVGGTLPRECEAVLIGNPLFVNGGVFARLTAQNLAGAVIDTNCRTTRVVLCDGGSRYEVKWTGAETVCRAGKSTNGANLDRVTREVRREGTTRNICRC